MAAGGSGESLSGVGSDHTFTYECDSCRYEGTVSEGTGYCVICQEFLCDACFTVHKRSKLSRDHGWRVGASIHQATKLTTSTSSTSVEFCDIHRDRPLTYFCKTHDALICDTCRSIKHRKCPDVKNIDEICADKQGSEGPAALLGLTKSLISKFKALRNDRSSDLDHLAKQKKACFDSVGKLRDDWNKMFDSLENNLSPQINQLVAAESKTISDDMNILQGAIETLEKSERRVEHALSRSDDAEAFIALRRVGLLQFNEVCHDIQEEQCRTEFRFEADDILLDLHSNLSQLGQLKISRPSTKQARDVNDQSEDGIIAEVPATVKNGRFVKAGVYSVKTASDNKACYISGCQFTPGGDLLMCDFFNSTLKLLDTHSRKLASLKLINQPWDVAVISPNEAVVTVPDEKKLLYITVLPQMKLAKKVNVGKCCRGVSCTDNKLYVTQLTDSPQVLVLSLEGQILSTLGQNFGQFGTPYHLTVDKRGRIYVSYSGRDTLTCFSQDGQVVYEYCGREFSKPKQLLVDGEQCVIVCWQESNTVQVITAEGVQHSTLLTSRDGIKRPVAIAYSHRDRMLVIGSFSSDEVVAFHVQ